MSSSFELFPASGKSIRKKFVKHEKKVFLDVKGKEHMGKYVRQIKTVRLVSKMKILLERINDEENEMSQRLIQLRGQTGMLQDLSVMASPVSIKPTKFSKSYINEFSFEDKFLTFFAKVAADVAKILGKPVLFENCITCHILKSDQKKLVLGDIYPVYMHFIIKSIIPDVDGYKLDLKVQKMKFVEEGFLGFKPESYSVDDSALNVFKLILSQLTVPCNIDEMDIFLSDFGKSLITTVGKDNKLKKEVIIELNRWRNDLLSRWLTL